MRSLPTLLAIGALATLFPRVSAQETLIRHIADPKTDTHVEVLALFSEPSRGGFLPVRVKLVNNLARPLPAKLDFNARIGYRERIRCQSSFSFAVPAGKIVTRDILVPLSPSTDPRSYGDNVQVNVRLSGAFGGTTGSLSGEASANLPATLMSEKLFNANASKLDAAAKSRGGSRYGGDSFAGSFSARQLPSDWQAFSGYDCVMISESEWSDVPAGARNAILSWTRLGGRLIVCTEGGATTGSLGLPEDPGFGTCELFPVLGAAGPFELPDSKTVNLVSAKPPVRPIIESTANDYQSGWPLQAKFGSRAFRYGLFIAVLIVFSILVGPVNLFVFAKSGMRHRLFLTTPAISLVASLLLVALIIFQDGFGGSGVRRVLMEVRPDAGQNAAYIHQEQISRSGILIGNDFTVDPVSFISPVPIAKSRWSRYTNDYDTKGSFHLQPTDGKLNASGDWWQSRSEHGHVISSVLPTRGRIEAAPGGLVSTFEFPIERLFYQDNSGGWHRAEDIRTGKAFTLTPVEPAMVEPELAKEAGAFSTRHRRMFERARKRPDHYVAITHSAPAIETHPGMRWKETRTIITGPVK